MRRLIVEEFSCIESASLDLNQLTVLIGPQASGKSVLSKLVYFFYSLINDQFLLLQEGQAFPAFRSHIQTKFREWFPVSAWGKGQFRIEFKSGEYYVRLRRGISKKPHVGSIRISISPFFEQQYSNTLRVLEEGAKRVKGKGEAHGEFELFWKAQNAAIASLAKRLGDDYVQSQLFVPAGRSFFTSVGKAVAAFEQARVLDPITISFGRFFSAIRDRRFTPYGRPTRSKILTYDWMHDVFGGELKFERDKEYLLTKDGRQIPFSALSSGQQELLPLIMALEYWAERQTRGALIYIEEPEAHLFPSAQNALIEILTSVAMNRKSGSDVVLTTHSPYVLAKLNNLARAGFLAAQVPTKALQEIDKVVPQKSWIPHSCLNAYAIKERRLVSIIDQYGMIDGEYLDSVSEEISREFSQLQVLEAKYVDRGL
jgi:ABC-type cobalamin/Fe3+-siderophores transport system ATPase subunit